jgi:endonuclease/exonuclease/phosphatase family metal-dependent hydrolase
MSMPRLRLMTYNVRYFGHTTRGVVSTRRGIRQIADTIAALDPLVDILCLQEVEADSLRSSLVTWRPAPLGRPTQLEALMRDLDRALAARGEKERYVASYFPAHSYRLTQQTSLYTTGLAILVRERHAIVHDSVQARRAVDITHRRGAKALKQTRICAHLTVRAAEGGGSIDVFNTHMSLPGPFYPQFWTRRERFGFGPNQVLEARRLLEAIRHRRSADHMVLVGDFNSLPGSPVDRVLRQEGGLVDALATAKGLTGERLRDWFTAGFMSKRMNIDRIYSSQGLQWLDFEGSRPFDEQHGRPSFAGLSDHVPIVGTMHLGG